MGVYAFNAYVSDPVNAAFIAKYINAIKKAHGKNENANAMPLKIFLCIILKEALTVSVTEYSFKAK